MGILVVQTAIESAQLFHSADDIPKKVVLYFNLKVIHWEIELTVQNGNFSCLVHHHLHVGIVPKVRPSEKMASEFSQFD